MKFNNMAARIKNPNILEIKFGIELPEKIKTWADLFEGVEEDCESHFSSHVCKSAHPEEYEAINEKLEEKVIGKMQ